MSVDQYHTLRLRLPRTAVEFIADVAESANVTPDAALRVMAAFAVRHYLTTDALLPAAVAPSKGRGAKGEAGEPPARLLRRPEVRAITGLTDTTLDRAMAREGFPRPVKLSTDPRARAVGWPSPAVDAWVRRRIAQNPT